MEVEKQIREIIEFYCGGTYENRNTATKEILQICQNLQLQQTTVIVSGGYLKQIYYEITLHISKINCSMDYCNYVDNL